MTDLGSEYRSLKTEIHGAIDRVLESGLYVLGEELEAFEEAFARYVGAGYAIGVGSGTAALHLALAALDLSPEDEVITVPNTDTPTAAAVTHAGAKVVLSDTTEDSFTMDPVRLEEAITSRTRVIIPVHLFGHPADLDPIRAIADRHGIVLLEDSALAVGAIGLSAIDGFARGAEEAAARSPISLGLFEYLLFALLGGYGMTYPWHELFSVKLAYLRFRARRTLVRSADETGLFLRKARLRLVERPLKR